MWKEEEAPSSLLFASCSRRRVLLPVAPYVVAAVRMGPMRTCSSTMMNDGGTGEGIGSPRLACVESCGPGGAGGSCFEKER